MFRNRFRNDRLGRVRGQLERRARRGRRMLAILTTHPIQYQVPLWQALARDGRVPFEVWYLTKHAAYKSRDREFGRSFAWDLEMLSGYPHRFLNVDPSARPNTFWKCRLRGNFAEELRRAKAK